MKIYLDNCSTTRVSSEAANAAFRAMTEVYANPSAPHYAGQEAERLVKRARQKIAVSIGAKPGNIVFTSGATESDNLALFSAFYSGHQNDSGEDKVTAKQGTLLVSAVEHPAVLAAADTLSARGVKVERIPVFGPDTASPGMVNIADLREMLAEDVKLVSILHVSNEIGTIQPVEEISRVISMYNSDKSVRVRLHIDAAQSYGKIHIDAANGDFQLVDFISLSAHKLHGPKGTGALFAASPNKLHPVIFGGGQEGGIRSGTENVPGIAGFAAAVHMAGLDIVGHAKHANACRRRLLEGIVAEVPDIHINSPRDASITGKAGCCSPYILSVGFLGTRGEVLVHELEKSGIYVSTGSACASRDTKNKGNDVLAAVGIPAGVIEGTLRFGISWENNIDEMEFTVDRLKKAVERFRRVGRSN